MSTPTIIELKNIDSEDIDDILQKLEKSFGFKFGKTELKDVKTFGELCDIVTYKVQGSHVEDCTTQQAFYRLRNAIAAIQLIDMNVISPNTELQQLFPRHQRRIQLKRLQSELNIPIDILDIKEWLGWTIIIGIIISLITFFFNWQFSLSGLAFFIAVGWTANKYFANELELKTIGQLAKKLSWENYSQVRSSPMTVNRNEIEQIVIELFSNDLALERQVLTREATFIWH